MIDYPVESYSAAIRKHKELSFILQWVVKVEKKFENTAKECLKMTIGRESIGCIVKILDFRLLHQTLHQRTSLLIDQSCFLSLIYSNESQYNEDNKEKLEPMVV